MVLEGLLDTPCGGGADALVDLESLRQVHGSFTGVAVREADPAESFIKHWPAAGDIMASFWQS